MRYLMITYTISMHANSCSCEVSTLFPWPAVMEKVQYERRKAQFFLMLGILHFNFWLALSK